MELEKLIEGLPVLSIQGELKEKLQGLYTIPGELFRVPSSYVLMDLKQMAINLYNRL